MDSNKIIDTAGEAFCLFINTPCIVKVICINREWLFSLGEEQNMETCLESFIEQAPESS